ncbi:23S rRNA (pseudouridine1915-N3)-methyltransferase [Mariniphaga anaerophila]|uniref:Ribosomal RNA large subunit methyltransferase H n=1 Tax=Mariniphaga anaerophila TaxID=1484053 RepID=A0A1M4YX18_9BACT|nr:23S rRNA (pseudouridine(1915)-N(3))-methyltransferase RlmH [Mariniphaga anaerophila]SHF10359.1 23S rRNA (pseudouridine1915-N3)-methyltransferase [Mariniphaga anaerophila]
MRLTLLMVGKTDEKYLQEGIAKYKKRLGHYIDFRLEVIPDIKKAKNLNTTQQKIKEGELILAKQAAGKEFHLFDENGSQMTSRQFAEFLQKKMASGIKELVFVIGGPYGFSDAVYEKAESKLSLSKMTFSHQLARLLCIEQFYRAFTILKGEPYHHD